jgi:hypothetical protein
MILETVIGESMNQHSQISEKYLLLKEAFRFRVGFCETSTIVAATSKTTKY